jgi:hypothetical protein
MSRSPQVLPDPPYGTDSSAGLWVEVEPNGATPWGGVDESGFWIDLDVMATRAGLSAADMGVDEVGLYFEE